MPDVLFQEASGSQQRCHQRGCRGFHRLAALVLLGTAFFACGESGSEEPRTPSECLADPDCDRVMVTAHRGFHDPYPENSLAAVRATAEVGAEFAEVDVAHTIDEVLILMHDGTVDRTTDGTGPVEGPGVF